MLFKDDFTGGLRLDSPGSAWRPGAALDGRAEGSPTGLTVVPTGVDPATGNPAFLAGPDSPAPRWSAQVQRTSSAGVNGFDTRPGTRLTGAAELQVEVYGPAESAAGALLALDRESGLLTGFRISGSVVQALYERLPLPGADHAAFGYAVPVAGCRPGRFHGCAVSLGDDGVRWELDGREVWQVTDPGLRPTGAGQPAWHLPGEESPLTVRQLGFGLALYAERALGQGLRLRVRDFTVTATADHGSG